MAVIQDNGDKLIKTAVEKIHLTDCQNLLAHSCSVYLGRQTPNINLSWGVNTCYMYTLCAHTAIISSFCSDMTTTTTGQLQT